MPAINVKHATVEDVHHLYNLLPEFSALHSLQDLINRLNNRETCILVAYKNEKPVGFKLGYALNDTTFYSWLGGVLPHSRRDGIAQVLLHTQEDWALNHGYQHIEVKTRNCFPAMLIMLIKNGYQLSELEVADNIADNRVRLVKCLTHGTNDK